MTAPEQALARLFTTMEKRKEDQRNERRKAEDAKLSKLTKNKPLWWQEKE